MKVIDKYTFLGHVFKYLEENEVPIVCSPEFHWQAMLPTSYAFRQDRTIRSWYFSVAAHAVPPDGKLRRSKELFSTAHCVVLDDVGTKVPVPPKRAKPSWVIESSAGNYQYGFLINPYPYRSRFEYALRMLAYAGFTDAGCIDAVHLFRVPGSLHGSGFIAKLHKWEPRRRNHLSEVMDWFGLGDPDEIPEAPHQFKGRPVTEASVRADEYYQWLLEAGMVEGGMNSSGWVPIHCPWADQHTRSHRPDNAQARYKPGARSFTCFHESCAAKTSMDFFRWVMDKRIRHV